jgi:Asp-tRNA(Asn)/Glu-tRNA(Gln) amidotransferase A subunit family amidase
MKMSTLDVQRTSNKINLVEASIEELLHTLNVRAISSVQLVSLYLHRIGYYDCRGPSLNSVCVLNPNAFHEAQESDDYRASGLPPRPLEGIPFTVKDSFKVKGMTVAAGSPAFSDLVASDDAAIVSLLREAGAILIGKTNMPAMADGGGQRGLYGRAESPYNPTYSTTAYASGSSNGSGTSTAASFAAFGLAGETVSSGRAPASNNALIGYSPSRGLIPNRGQWPLYPTCDVIVPHTRKMKDLFVLLDVIVADDKISGEGVDFWRNQQFVPIPHASDVRPVSFNSLADPYSLIGKRVAVPRCFIGIQSAKPFYVCTESVQRLWKKTRATLEGLGATVIESDFPFLEQYTKKDFPGQSCNVPGMPSDWNSVERCQMIATAWDDFLRQNKDPNCSSLPESDPDKIHPHIAPMDDPIRFTETHNQVRYSDMIEFVKNRTNSVDTLPGTKEAIQSLENMRKREFEDWMDSNDFDLLAFPTNGDVAYANCDEEIEPLTHALQDGVKYSNGGRSLKHCGIPCITVPMGTMKSKRMPVGVTFASKAYADNDLLRYAYAYEAATHARTIPSLTPPLPTDYISLSPLPQANLMKARPFLEVTELRSEPVEGVKQNICRHISMEGTVLSSDQKIGVSSVKIFVNGEESPVDHLSHEKWKWETTLSRPERVERFPEIGKVPKNQFLIVVIASLNNGRDAASMFLLD